MKILRLILLVAGSLGLFTCENNEKVTDQEEIILADSVSAELHQIEEELEQAEEELEAALNDL